MKRSITFMLLVAGIMTSCLAQNTGIQKDISYKSGDAYTNERCKLDIRVPSEPGVYPVVVWFHGGGLESGNKYFPGEMLDAEAVLVAANYRLVPKVEVKDCLDDAAAAVAWVIENIDQYGGDPGQVIVSGHSAGGYLTSMIGLDKQWLAKYNVDADDINALFPFSGHTISHMRVREAMGIPANQPYADEMSPLYHVRPDAPPLYLMTGGRDVELYGRYEENAYMYRMMLVNGHKETYLYEFDGHDHGAMVAPGCHVLKTYLEKL